MSSRVQKGSTVFRPVVKARSRTAGSSVSRQNSVITENSSTTAPSSLPLPLCIVPEQTVTRGEFVQHSELAPSAASHVAQNIVAVPPKSIPTPIAAPIRSAPLQAPPQISGTASSEAADPVELSVYVPPPIPTLQSSPAQGPTQDVIFQPTLPGVAIAAPIAGPSTSLPAPPEVVLPDGAEARPRRRRARKSAEDNVETPKRKRRKASTPADGSESESRSRGSSKTPRPRKRAPSVPPYDPDADPGDEIDPTAVTMASICSDTGHGRVSSKAIEILNNHSAWKVKNREKRARMKAVMEAKKYGRTEEDVDAEADAEGTRESRGQAECPTPTSTSAVAGPSTPTDPPSSAPLDETGHGFDYSQNLETSRYTVQVRIGPNGETIIDEDSLLVDRAENDGTENYTHVTESDYTKFVNSATYGRRYRGSRWSAEETELFYEALSQYGENYELIACILPGRDRKACKNKFKAEDKKNPARINYCLNNRIPVDMKTLSRMTGKDFSGPVPEIRAPPPPVQTAEPAEPLAESSTQGDQDGPRSVPVAQPKKRVRSKSHGAIEEGVVIIGDATGFES